MTPEKTTGLRMLWKFYRRYIRDIALMVFFFLFQHAYAWCSPILVALLIDLATEETQDRMPRFFLYAGVMVAMIAWNLPASLLRTRYQSRTTRGVSRDLRVSICRQLQQLTLLYHDKHSVGRLQSKAIRDIEVLEQLPGQFVWLLLVTGVNIVVAVIAISVRAPKALFFFAAMVPVSVTLRWYFRRKMEMTAKRYRETFEDMSAGLTDMMTMIPVTRAHGLEEFELSRVTDRIQKVFRRGRMFDNLWELFAASNYVTFALSQGLFLLGSIYYCFQGVLTVGDVVMFNAFFASISGSILALVNVVPVLTNARESAISVGELLDTPDHEQNEGKARIRSITGHLVLDNVSYSYPDTGFDAIESISLDLPAGQATALVGPSGAGKSTMLALLLGFIRPTAGRILLDGRDMQELDLRSYRKLVGVVTQDIVFFSGSIRDNVAYGREAVTDAEVKDALQMAHAWDFVEKLPDGVETQLGESGIKLSGGQHQRLAIARALIRDPRILLLDEATSALDMEAEWLVQQALKRVMKNRTCIVIAHRLSTVKICNQIVVLKDGRIDSQGSHDALLESENFYSRIVRSTV